MRPEDAVRQLEYVIDASLDEAGSRHAPMYAGTFRRVAEAADGRAVAELADELGAVVRGGRCPRPAEAEAAAERVLGRERALTDGGE